jgi:hypothetical protein
MFKKSYDKCNRLNYVKNFRWRQITKNITEKYYFSKSRGADWTLLDLSLCGGVAAQPLIGDTRVRAIRGEVTDQNQRKGSGMRGRAPIKSSLRKRVLPWEREHWKGEEKVAIFYFYFCFNEQPLRTEWILQQDLISLKTIYCNQKLRHKWQLRFYLLT